MPNVVTFEFTSDHAVPIQVPLVGTATVTNLAGDTLYYSDNSAVSASANQGSLTAGQSAIFSSLMWVRSASRTEGAATISGPVIATSDLPASAVMASAYLVPTGGDDSAAMANALANFAPFAYPVVVLGPGTFQWNSQVPKFLRNTPAVIQGAGRGKTIIRLNGSARFFDFNKVADYDAFHHITVRGLTLDANNALGRNAAIGNFAAGGIQTRIQWHDLLFEDIEGINGHPPDNDLSGTNVWRWFNLWSVSDEGDTQMSNYNITFRDIWLSGGAYGFQVVGSPITGGAHWSNTINDKILLENCHHDIGVTPIGFPTNGAGNFHFGSASIGKSIRMVNCTGTNSWDVGIELDGWLDAVVIGTRITDCWGLAFLNTNFATIPDLQSQRILWQGCTFVRTAQNTNYSVDSCAGWRSQTTANFATQYPSQVDIVDCKALINTGIIQSIGEAINVTQTRRLNVRGFTVAYNGVVTTPSSGSIGPFKLKNGVGAGAMGVCHLSLKDIMVHVDGAASLTGYVFNPLLLSNTGETYLDIDGFDIDYTLSGGSATCFRGIQIGDSSAGQTANGRIRRLRVLALSGDSAPATITIQDTNWVTIPDKFEVSACDWVKMAGGSEIFFRTSGGGTAQNGKVYACKNVWHTNPAPSTLAGLVTATGAALNTNTACNVTFVQGSGTAITAIDYSTNGGTTYTNFLTQASGALPAGFDQTLGILRPQDLIKVTFTGTQPTINLVPVDP